MSPSYIPGLPHTVNPLNNTVIEGRLAAFSLRNVEATEVPVHPLLNGRPRI